MQIKDAVIVEFGFCASTQRFARFQKNTAGATSMVVGSSWPIPILGRLYGPGGLADGVFRSWVGLHNSFFGIEHVAAFLSLTGMAQVTMALHHPPETGLLIYRSLSCNHQYNSEADQPWPLHISCSSIMSMWSTCRTLKIAAWDGITCTSFL